MNCLFIGCGNMGGSILKKIRTKVNTIILKPSNKIDDALKDIKIIKTIKELEFTPDFIFLAVKPNIIKEALLLCKDFPDATIISMAAGVKIETMEEVHKGKYIRIMPNIAVAIGNGVTTAVSKNGDIEAFKNIYSQTGKLFFLSNEDQIDKSTAISGSGPAYFFLFLEYFQEVAKKLDLEFSDEIAYETFIGAAELLKETKQSPNSLRTSVTSPNGTTDAAIKSFQKDNNMSQLIEDAVNSAYNRAMELSK